MSIAVRKRKGEETIKVSVGAQQRKAMSEMARLAADPEDAGIVMWEAMQSPHRGKKTSNIEVLKFDKDVFGGDALSYPRLFSAGHEFQMTRYEFLTELGLILDMAPSGNFEVNPYVYSIQVMEPRNLGDVIESPEVKEFFGGELPTDIRNGYVYHSVLYKSPPFVRTKLIEAILGHARLVEVTLRGPSADSIQRKAVELR
jgi:hypothetical protein